MKSYKSDDIQIKTTFLDRLKGTKTISYQGEKIEGLTNIADVNQFYLGDDMPYLGLYAKDGNTSLYNIETKEVIPFDNDKNYPIRYVYTVESDPEYGIGRYHKIGQKGCIIEKNGKMIYLRDDVRGATYYEPGKNVKSLNFIHVLKNSKSLFETGLLYAISNDNKFIPLFEQNLEKVIKNVTEMGIEKKISNPYALLYTIRKHDTYDYGRNEKSLPTAEEVFEVADSYFKGLISSGENASDVMEQRINFYKELDKSLSEFHKPQMTSNYLRVLDRVVATEQEYLNRYNKLMAEEKIENITFDEYLSSNVSLDYSSDKWLVKHYENGRNLASKVEEKAQSTEAEWSKKQADQSLKTRIAANEISREM